LSKLKNKLKGPREDIIYGLHKLGPVVKNIQIPLPGLGIQENTKIAHDMLWNM